VSTLWYRIRPWSYAHCAQNADYLLKLNSVYFVTSSAQISRFGRDYDPMQDRQEGWCQLWPEPGGADSSESRPVTQHTRLSAYQQPALPLIQVRKDGPGLRRWHLLGSLCHADSTS
jgi:hypothetical protein